LETEASRQAALDQARADACKPSRTYEPAGLPNGPAETNLPLVCKTILEELGRDQRDGRPDSLTNAAACALDSRHRTMAARIVEAAKTGEKPFVIVGRAHLVPGKNLIDLLAEQGLAVRRIE